MKIYEHERIIRNVCSWAKGEMLEKWRRREWISPTETFPAAILLRLWEHIDHQFFACTFFQRYFDFIIVTQIFVVIPWHLVGIPFLYLRFCVSGNPHIHRNTRIFDVSVQSARKLVFQPGRVWPCHLLAFYLLTYSFTCLLSYAAASISSESIIMWCLDGQDALQTGLQIVVILARYQEGSCEGERVW